MLYVSKLLEVRHQFWYCPFLACCAILCVNTAAISQQYWIDKTGKHLNFRARFGNEPVPNWRYVDDKDLLHQIAPSGKIFQVEPLNGESYSEDRVRISVDGKLGYADYLGKIVISPQFVEARCFYKGQAIVRRTTDTGYEIIDKAGNTMIVLPNDLTPAGWEGVTGNDLIDISTGEPKRRGERERHLYSIRKKCFVPLPENCTHDFFSEDRAMITVGRLATTPPPHNIFKHGFIDADGEIVIQPIYDYAKSFHNGLAPVCRDHRYFYIDKQGKEVIALPPDCCDACEFREGLAAVALGGQPDVKDEDGVPRRGSRLAFIDTKG